MSDLPQQDTINQYTADGISLIYNYTYLVPTDVDIAVYVTPPGQQASDQDDIQTLGVDYTVQNAGDVSGGTVTFIIAPNGIVTLSRAVEASIDTNYVDPKTIIGLNLDNSFERGMLVGQQNQSKFDDRSLRFEISSFLPDSSGNNIVPTLGQQQIWIGTASGKVAAATLEEDPDCSTLRSELANENPGTDGATLVGYYDISRSLNTTVDAQFNDYPINTIGADGAKLIGYYDDISSIETNVSSYLSNISELIIATGSGNFIELAPLTPITAYAIGQRFKFKALATNSAAASINVSGLGNIPVNLMLPSGLSVVFHNMIIQDGIYDVIYDGSVFQLENPSTSLVLSSAVSFQPTTTQIIPPTGGKVEFDTTVFDTNGWWNQPSHRFVPTIRGKYSIYVSVFGTASADSQGIEIYKNGSLYLFLSQSANVIGGSQSTPSGSIGTVEANGTTDYFEIFWSNGGPNNVTLGSSPNSNKFSYFEIKYEGS